MIVSSLMVFTILWQGSSDMTCGEVVTTQCKQKTQQPRHQVVHQKLISGSLVDLHLPQPTDKK